jgi:hypothetical protein
MSQVRKKIAPPLVGSDIILVIRPGQSASQVLDCTYDQLVQSLQQYFTSSDGFVPETRTLTINGVTYDLSEDRSWTVSGSGAVDSVNGQTGVVVLALDNLSDVNASAPTNGQILQWNGTQWVSATVGAAAWGSIGAGTGVGSQADLVTYLAANYQVIGSYVLTTRTITINGVAQDLSANRTWNLTANNGVQQETGNLTNFELGGSIIKNTLIEVGPSSSGDDLQFNSNGPLGGSGKIKFTATAGGYTSTDKLVRFEANGAISAYFIADGTNGTGVFIQSLSSGAVPMIISDSSSAEIFKMLNSGQLILGKYTTSTSFGSGLTSQGILNIDNTGKVFVTPAPTGTGTVSSVGTAGLISGGPITTTGTITTSMNTNKLVGRGTPGVGVMEEITLGTGLSLTGTTLNATGGGGLKSGTATQVSAGVYTTTIAGVTSYTAGDTYIIKFDSVNDGDSTLNILGVGVAVPMRRNTDVKLNTGAIKANQEITVVYDGTNFQLIGLVNDQILAYVHNAEGAIISKGQAVYAYQANGGKMSVKLARADSDATSAKTIGLVYDSSIGIGGEGYIITQGVLEGVNTSMFSAGDTLYLSGVTFGAYVSTPVYAPTHFVYVGIVERANANGQIYVRCQNGYEMDEIHDVAIAAPYPIPVDNDVLTYIAGPPNLWQARSVSSLLPTSVKTGSFGVTVDGVTGVVQVGTVGYVVMPYNGTITGWSITANVSGNIQFDIWKATNAIPTVANTQIPLAANRPKLTAQQYVNSTTLTGWTTSFLANDVFGFYVDSASTIKNATLTIRTTKT